MKAIALLALPICAALIAACKSPENMAAAAPASQGEFEPATGSWKPLTRVVPAPPPQQGAVIAEEKGTFDKVGETVSKTLKKPLEWVGLAKDETPSAAPSKKPGTQP